MSDGAIYRKMAFVGGVASGKSTIVRTLSDSAVVNTDRPSSVDIGKELTTIGIDYGRINLAPTMALGLYGVPGQARFSMLWQYVNHGLWGLAHLYRVNDPEALDTLLQLIDFFAPKDTGTPFVVALTHLDEASEAESAAHIEVVKSVLGEHDMPDLVLGVDCRERQSAISVPYLINAIHGGREHVA